MLIHSEVEVYISRTSSKSICRFGNCLHTFAFAAIVATALEDQVTSSHPELPRSTNPRPCLTCFRERFVSRVVIGCILLFVLLPLLQLRLGIALHGVTQNCREVQTCGLGLTLNILLGLFTSMPFDPPVALMLFLFVGHGYCETRLV